MAEATGIVGTTSAWAGGSVGIGGDANVDMVGGTIDWFMYGDECATRTRSGCCAGGCAPLVC